MYRLEVLEDKLITTPTGRKVRDLFAEHAEEVMMLINHNRRVALVWHRNEGPAFINHAVRSGYEDQFMVPEEVNGIKLSTLMRRMASAIQEFGSPGLRQAVGSHASMILSWAGRCNSLNQVFEEIHKLDKAANQ